VAAKPTADVDTKVRNAAASAGRYATQVCTELKPHERDEIRNNHEEHEDLEDRDT